MTGPANKDGRTRRRWVPLATAAALIGGVLVSLAATDEGYPAAKVSLTETSVWVTNTQEGLVGRVSTELRLLTSSLAASGEFDVLQDNDLVLHLDRTRDQLAVVDIGTVSLTSGLKLPVDAAVDLGGGVLAVADPADGRVWTGTPTELAGLDAETTPPTLVTAPGALVAVADDGTAVIAAAGSDHWWQPSGEVSTAPVSAAPTDDTTAAPATTGPGPEAAAPSGQWAGGELGPDATLTLVGRTPVALDPASGTLRTPDRELPLPDGDDPVLQQTGPAGDAVLVATATGLWRLPLDGSTAVALHEGADSRPAAPLTVAGCTHAAWQSGGDQPPVYLQQCGTDEARTVTIDGTAENLVFRENKGAVLLNNARDGTTWQVDEDMNLTTIDNWEQVDPQREEEQEETDDDSRTDSLETAATKANCVTTEATRPEARPAEYTVRPGRSTVLPLVADFVTVGDCAADALSGIVGAEDGPARVEVVGAGQSVQVTVPADATGELPPLTYLVGDGVTEPVEQSLVVRIAAPDAVGELEQRRESITTVRIGGTVTYRVLDDWFSDVRDDLYLASAKVAGDDDVRFTPDGVITFADAGTTGTQTKVVEYIVSDGETTATGTLRITVVEQDDLNASAVTVTGTAGVPVNLRPLQAVLSTAADPLQLGKITPRAGAEDVQVSADGPSGRVALQAAEPGTYHLVYEVSAGEATATGIIRFDVTAVPTEPVPPVVMTDTVYLPEGEPVRFDPTVNDVDPMGKGLAVQQIGADTGNRLTVLVDMLQTVQVAARGRLSSPVTLSYTASNGVGSTVGEVRVIPVPALSDPPAPRADPIAVRVRAGDAVTLPIARHAVDPRGQALTVDLVHGAALEEIPGTLFTTDTAIRYLAPVQPPVAPIKFSYTVTNTSGATSDPATVIVTVVPAPADDAANTEPGTPEPVLGRVRVGQTLTLGLPVDGIDPDGDWAVLSAVGRPQQNLGVAGPSGVAGLSYAALGQPGVDTVPYTVTDPSGASAEGTATVLVVAEPDEIAAPVAPNLQVDVRPDKAVVVRVLDQVSGTGVRLADEPFVAPDGWVVEPDGGNLVIRGTGHGVGEIAAIQYSVVDERGLSASGVITVTVSAQAALVPPAARDVFVTTAAVSNGQATVDITGSADNGTGPAADLDLAVDAPATADGRQLVVTVTERRQVIPWTVTDIEGQVATAFLVVPTLDELVPPPPPEDPEPTSPVLVGNIEPLVVDAGQSVTAAVTDYVTVPDGAPAVIPAGSVLSATQGTVEQVDSSSFRYSAPITGSGPDVVRLSVGAEGAEPIQVSVPVTIIPQVPALRSYTVSAEVGGAAATVDLRSLLEPANHPQADAMVYSTSSGDAGFSVAVDGSVLSVQVAASVPKGSTSAVTVTVTDPQGRSAQGTVTVAATTSTKPLATLVAQNVEGRPGVASSLSVLAGATDPIGGGLSVVPGSVSVVRGEATPVLAGDVLQVTPAAGQIGEVQVSFLVADGTGDPDRQVPGTAVVVVRDQPGAPGTPRVRASSATAVEVSWEPSADNGAGPVTYVVTANGAPVATCAGEGTVCTADGLTPGTTYVFAVGATNQVGGPVASPPSAPVVPDAVPTVPAAPQASWQAAGRITVTWAVPTGTFSAVTRMELQTLMDGAVVDTQDVTGTETVVTGEQGHAYTFVVRAHNRVGPSDAWSQPSPSVNPSNKPTAPQNVGTTFVYTGSERRLEVTWDAPTDTGGEAVSYNVSLDGNQVAAELTEPGWSLSEGVQDRTYTFVVTAVNVRGTADAPGPPVPTFTRPDQPAAPSAQVPAGNNTAVLTLAPAGGRNRPVDRTEVQIENGATSTHGATATSADIGGLASGQEVRFRSRMCYADETGFGADVLCGDWSGLSNGVIPYGTPGAPTNVRATGNSQTQISFAWDAPPDNGRGPLRAEISVDNAAWANLGGETTWTGTWACGQGHSIRVRYLDSQGLAGGDAGASGSTQNCPPPTWTYSASTEMCPQDQWNSSNYSAGPPAGCTIGGVPNSWLVRDTSVTVSCYVDRSGRSNYPTWYRMDDGPRAGMYVPADGTYTRDPLKSRPGNMPACA